MVQAGVIPDEDFFYDTLLAKWNEYLHRIRSGQQLVKILGHDLKTTEEIRQHLEEIKIYIRGHNLFDIFYGPFKKQEQQILKTYIDLAPKEEFQDILEAIEKIPYFENRRRKLQN